MCCFLFISLFSLYIVRFLELWSYLQNEVDVAGNEVCFTCACVYMHMGACMLGCISEALNIYIFASWGLAASGGIEVLVGGAEQEETEQGKIEGKERVPEACPGSDGSPDNLLCNGLPLSLWVLWNCRPALYSWGLRGDKRPFNSERGEVTEREALREGYQSDIHHTNLSLGTGPAKEGALEVVLWAYMCVCDR